MIDNKQSFVAWYVHKDRVNLNKIVVIDLFLMCDRETVTVGDGLVYCHFSNSCPSTTSQNIDFCES